MLRVCLCMCVYGLKGGGGGTLDREEGRDVWEGQTGGIGQRLRSRLCLSHWPAIHKSFSNTNVNAHLGILPPTVTRYFHPN